MKDLLTGGGQGLGVGLSSATLAALPSVKATPANYAKFGVSTVCGVAGMCLLMYGKKAADLKMMIWGAALTLISFFVF